jgi:hypothetical protein
MPTTTHSPLATSFLEAGKELASQAFGASTNGTAEGKVAAIADFAAFVEGRITATEFLDRVRWAESQANSTGTQGLFGRSYIEAFKALINL